MATNEDIVRRLGKLQSTLLTSGLQQRDQPLYQVINQLIKAVIDASSDTIATIDSGGGGGATSDDTFITVDDELATLPQSSQLVAGDNVTFDTSVFGQLRIDVADFELGYYDAPLTDGDLTATELIFADGECVIVQVPNP
jgi:hypothetical protein